MKKNALRLALACLALAVAGVAGCGGVDDVPANAVATIDGTTITKTELDELMERARKSYEAQKREFPKAGTTEYQGLQAQAVAYLVQRVEYDIEAAARGIEVTAAEIEKRRTEVIAQNFDGDAKKLSKALEEQGVTEEQLRADLRVDVLASKLADDVSKGITVSAAEVSKYYETNKSQYTVPESRDVRHILVKKKTEADELYADLQNGADFAALAKKHSQDPGSKDNGGKLTIARGQTVAPFEKVAFAIAVGTVSKPVKTEFGFHLIEALGKVKPGKVTPLSEAKAQIKAQLEQTERQEVLAKWVTDLQAKYKKKISYGTGYEPPDTSTTSSETPSE